ncbi:hypothetical protein KGS77_18365 [Streptomyces sp. MST-110588]|nr:hypothetical protein KGS77_18365 [Streptomyces sp. MST-110588]
MGGVAVMVAGLAFAAWLVFGPVHYWEGGARLDRMAMGLAAMGAISGGAWLIFWEPESDRAAEEASEEASEETTGEKLSV